MIDLVFEDVPASLQGVLRTLLRRRERLGDLPFRVVQHAVRTTGFLGTPSSPQVRFGSGVRLLGGGSLRLRGRVVVNDGVRFEIERGTVCLNSRVSVGAWSTIVAGDPESFVRVGADVYVGPYCYLDGRRGLTIGPHTAIGPHCALIAESLGLDPHTPRAQQPQAGKPITIGGNVWIGSGAKILGGTSIGDGAIVGAGAVVTKDVPARAVAVGVPARVVRLLD